MDGRVNGIIYIIITFIYSSLTFIVLLPELKNILYSRCVWKFGFNICNHFFGIEAAYRITLVVVIFYVIMSLVTIKCRGNQLLWYCQDSCFTKIFVLILANFIGFVFPFTRTTMETLYNVFLIFAVVFLAVMFYSMIDCAHAFRMLWLNKIQTGSDEPTCYLCTWLFLIHLTSAFLYALSFDLILSFYFFNKLEECINTMVFLLINVVLCLMCCSISYFPTLRHLEAASQIIFAAMVFSVVYVTWLALSDPENEFCNMYGTIFTGSILESSTSFRSLISLIVMTPTVIFHCFKSTNSHSFVMSLITQSKTFLFCLDYSLFHVVMFTASSFVLMSVTNFYEPVYSMVETSGTGKRGIKTSVIYFEGYNRFRFLTMSVLSSLLPSSYLCILTSRVMVTFCKNWAKERVQRKRENDGSTSTMDDKEFIYIPMTKAEALKRLKTFKPDFITNFTEQQNERNHLQYLLLQCFYIKSLDLSFWHFPRHICQTYFKGRNGSNACTVISMIVGRFFARSDLPYQNNGYLDNQWITLVYTAIEDGSYYYDTLVKEVGVLDLSIEEVYEKMGGTLNVTMVHASLPVSFESDVETATIIYQLKLLLLRRHKLVCLFIHNKRTSSFLIYENSTIVYIDSHAFGEDGALMICATENSLESLVSFLKELLGNSDIRLATLTVVEYEKRPRKYSLTQPFDHQ